MGAVATHLLATFTTEYYSLPGCKGEYFCNNKGALGQAAKILQQVPTGAKHSDLLRALRSIKAKCPMEFCYSHVRAHQDRQAFWQTLLLIEQLNVQCDNLAGQAVVTWGTMEGHSIQSPWDRLQLLPRECAMVFMDGTKLTSDVSDDVRHLLRQQAAWKFFTAPQRIVKGVNKGGLGWTKHQFDSIDWDSLQAALRKKSNMFGIWYAKQSIGI